MNKILIANRGEIAVRIIRTAKKMRINTVLVYAPQDAGAAYLHEADETVLLEGQSLGETYLNSRNIIAAAKAVHADAIHPGYGFLSENAAFAEACRKEGIIFIGPTPEAMEAMGDKIAARRTAQTAGVPVTPGITGTVPELLAQYASVGFPLLIKAAAGGGGKGMRVVQQETELKEALEATAREAKNYFGDDTVYIEKYIEAPRHVEVQVLGDQQGHIIHLFERECSLQRRHQKIIEEAPSPTLTPEVRDRICHAAVQLAAAIGYQSAGTLEFLVGPDLSFYFLEMNTRIQVEHPVTELTTGIDIVEQQIRIARGEPLDIRQKDIRQRGHAIECRIYAEDPEQQFLPAPGLLRFYKEPYGEHIRIDSMLLQHGSLVTGDFDPMIAKLITWGTDREAARKKMAEALQQYFIYGIKNNIAFLSGLLHHPDFIKNRISTKYIDIHLAGLLQQFEDRKKKEHIQIPLTAALVFSLLHKAGNASSIWETIGYWRRVPQLILDVEGKDIVVVIHRQTHSSVDFEYQTVSGSATLAATGAQQFNLILDQQSYPVHIFERAPGIFIIRYNGFDYTVKRNDILHIAANRLPPPSVSSATAGNICAPMPGKVIKIAVAPGTAVHAGDLLLIVEAMKMENNILSPKDGTVTAIDVAEGDKVDTTTTLIHIEDANSLVREDTNQGTK
ncbi:acetyl/propionyl/methylcrotonyl-CoA carboxylase subunit alpha [Niabella drilacis]|uniref:3-methylcrotonyl-CoA carboxylase alpha subunit n=1 Tax=Niabella drilacis (strain DSM 25811 / CCM 8410 / CCUG 62505 / LMG 26954 / E90) TaxID=1285928 RepID=A0A1G6ZS10_NIADE|nr:biotin carboxylase N-terminal domain-containing protein [Niabella drilacis]SDE05312.1 3-methylcrotonyl-CoA carboxylase alpha subunit [Niabella drilacis]